MTDTGGLLDFSLESSFAGQTRFPVRISELTFPFRFGTIESTRTSGDKTV